MHAEAGRRSRTLINDVIAGSYQAAAWRNHPGFDPDTQWVWWHCDAAPADVGGARRTPAPATSARTRRRQQLRQPGQLQRVQRPDHQQGPRDRPHEHRPGGPQGGLRGHQPGVRQAALGGWGYWSLWTVPYQTNVHGILGPNLPDGDLARRRARWHPYTGLVERHRRVGALVEEVVSRSIESEQDAARPNRSEGCEQHYGV